MPKVFGSTLTLVTFVLVVVVARLNSWDQFFFTFFKTFQTLGLGASIRSSVRVSIRIKAMVWVRFQVYLIRLLCFYQA